MLAQFIYNLNPVMLALLVLAGTLSASLLCVLFCRYFIKIAYSEDAEFKIETYSDAFGIAFAILLGLIIVSAWTSYDQTDDYVRSEVNYLNDLYRLSNYFNDSEKAELQQNLKKYVSHVIEEEWPLLPQGKYSKLADTILFHNFDILYRHGITDKLDEFVHSEVNKIATHLTEKRRSRILNAHSSLTPIMWIILISCNLIAFFILALAAQGPITFHGLLQSLYALGIGLMLLLVIILDRPFYYGVYYGGGISSEHFESLLHDWNEKEDKKALQSGVDRHPEAL
ncbi:MAG: DUF4239 domain-containing protein [Proteobacteria bacterium]|nr:DUF4239 domain-containing protein [Pseudomonadota bacterium]